MRLITVFLLLVAPALSLASIAPERTARPRIIPRPKFGRSPKGSPIFEISNEQLSRRGGADAPKLTTPPAQDALIILGCMLAANSGFMNGLTLSGLLGGKKQAVAAVTGGWTTSAIGFGAGNTDIATAQLRMIACYFGGSCLNGLMNPSGINWSRSPTTLLLMAGLVFVGALFYSSTDFFLSLLALVNGLQNSWTSMLINGNVLRTAHFSGCTSDMGTFVGQLLRGNDQNLWKLKIFARLAGSFWLGGLASVFLSKTYEEVSFLASVVLYLGIYGALAFRKANSIAVVKVAP